MNRSANEAKLPHDLSTDRARELAALNTVRRRVAAIGFMAVAGHGVIALPLLARHIEGQGRTGDAVVLLIVGGFLTMVTVVATRVILGIKPITPVWAVVPIAIPVLAGLWIWG